MQNEIQTLKSLFETNNVPVSMEWLQECCDWCRSELLNANYTLDELKHAIHDQWLGLDLRDIETAVLPPDLCHKKFMILKDNYSLQIMQVVDISKPKYWQLQQIRKENLLTRPPKNEINDSVGTGKRVLQLTLTDGVQYVEAMEYKPIAALNINLTPGQKIRLLGPITVRRGCIMLTGDNIRLLGGEVESLLISNAAENVLARAINLPENPNPQTVDVDMLTVDQEPETNKNQHHLPKPNTFQPDFKANTFTMDDNITDADLAMLMAAENELAEGNANMSNQLKRPQSENVSYNVPKIKRAEPTDDEIELLMEMDLELRRPTKIKQTGPTNEEMELLMELDEDYENATPKNNRMKENKTPDLFEDDFDPDQIDHLVAMAENKEAVQDAVATKNVPQMETSVLKKPRIISVSNNSTPFTSKENKSKHSIFDEFINEDDLFCNLDIDNIEANVAHKKSNIISIQQLAIKIEERKGGSYKIHAKFKAVAEKLTILKEEFRLVIVVEDGDSEITCQVHNDVISKWAGATAVEIIALKTNISSQDVEAMKKVQQTLQNIKDQLLEINHELEISINETGSMPIIMKISY